MVVWERKGSGEQLQEPPWWWLGSIAEGGGVGYELEEKEKKKEGLMDF